MSRGRPKTREAVITIGILKSSKKRLDILGFNLDLARGEIVDCLVGMAPKITKKLNPHQRRMMKLRIIRQGKKFFMENQK